MLNLLKYSGFFLGLLATVFMIWGVMATGHLAFAVIGVVTMFATWYALDQVEE